MLMNKSACIFLDTHIWTKIKCYNKHTQIDIHMVYNNIPKGFFFSKTTLIGKNQDTGWIDFFQRGDRHKTEKRLGKAFLTKKPKEHHVEFKKRKSVMYVTAIALVAALKDT